MHLDRRLPWAAIGCAILALTAATLLAPAAEATTVRPLTFDQIVDRAVLIVEGTVVGLETRYVGEPLTGGSDSPAVGAQAPATGGAAPNTAQGGDPTPVGVEGGRRIMTTVTLTIDEIIHGDASSPLVFELAGGTVGDHRMVVHGLPQLDVGLRYTLFFREGWQGAGDPLVGVDQGLFPIEEAEAGPAQVVDSIGNYVVGIEEGRLVRRYNADRLRGTMPTLAPDPVPDAGYAVVSTTSAEMARYWLSDATPLTPADLAAAVRAVLELER